MGDIDSVKQKLLTMADKKFMGQVFVDNDITLFVEFAWLRVFKEKGE